MASEIKIACALVFRLRGKNATCLAKYEHVTQWDTKFAETFAAVIRKKPPGTGSDHGVIGGFKAVVVDMNQFVYGADREGLCVGVITGQRYPSRIAHKLIIEIHDDFLSKYHTMIPTIKPNGLTKRSKSMLYSVCKKYEDFKNVDKAKALIEKVDGVKGQMAQNIQGMLDNTAKAQDIADESDRLNEEAQVFKKNTTELKKQMWWKDKQMTIILGCVILLILLYFTIPFLIRSSKSSKPAKAVKL